MNTAAHKNRLIPPPELAPPVPERATPQQCVRLWADLMTACDEMLKSTLRREAGPNGDIRPLYRQWYERQMEDHDQMIERMLMKLSDYERRHAR